MQVPNTNALINVLKTNEENQKKNRVRNQNETIQPSIKYE